MRMRARNAGRERGAALLEFVLVIPLFIYILYSIIGFGLALSLKEDITHAAAEGARAAIAVAPSTPQPQPTSTEEMAYCNAAKSRVSSVLSWLGSNAGYVAVTCTNPGGALSGTYQYACSTINSPAGGATDDPNGWCMLVSVQYPYGSDPLVPPEPGLGYFNPSSLSASAVIQVQ